MSSEKPTEAASELFDYARHSASRAVQASTYGTAENLTAHSLYCLAQGLRELSTGLRATYIKLEAVESQIRASTLRR